MVRLEINFYICAFIAENSERVEGRVEIDYL